MKERTDETVVGCTLCVLRDHDDHSTDAVAYGDLYPDFRAYIEGIEQENADQKQQIARMALPLKQLMSMGWVRRKRVDGVPVYRVVETARSALDELADQRRLVWAFATGNIVHAEWCRCAPEPCYRSDHNAEGWWHRGYYLGNGPLPVLTDEARKAIDETMENVNR